MRVKLYSAGVAALLLTACSSITPLQPAGAKVLTTTGTPPASCHALKTVAVQNNNGIDMHYRSHQEIETDQLNRLRNTAAALGGNLLVVRNHQTTYQEVELNVSGASTTKTADSDHSQAMVDTHAMAGDVYLCPAQDLLELPAIKPVSSVKLDDVD